ncbi:MAG: DUF1292 domain-containing protein [Clostridia bacterium]|nr:DUF1292 domain-containing protein [Clostridia bacterium]
MAESIENNELQEDDYVVLLSADGEEIQFIDIAGIKLEQGYYAILQPVELLPDMSSDEAIVFKVEGDENDNAKFTIELDETIIDKVFEEYYRLLDEENGGDGE